MTRRHRTGEPPELAAGLVVLPPEGWKLQEAAAGAVRDLWGPIGGLRLSVARIGGDPSELEKTLRRWADRDRLQVVCSIGRSGHRVDDFAPDVTRRLLDRSLPGVEERMYLSSPRRPEDLLFRGAAGIRKETIIINLPTRMGRLKTVLRFLAPVLRHAVEKVAGDESECARQR